MSVGYPVDPQCMRQRAIGLLLASDPKVLDLLFSPCRQRLSRSGRVLRRELGYLSTGEQLLARAALDLWDGSGRVALEDLVFRLDPIRIEGFLRAVEALRFTVSFRVEE